MKPVTGNYHYASTSNFNLGKYEEKENTFTFDPAYFSHSSYDFDPQLALVSMHMAQAAYGALEGDGDKFIREFLAAAGFQNIYTNEDYNKAPERHTAGVAVASRKLSEDTTLLAVAVRGGNYKDEWGGNFAIGKNTLEHEGFALGRNKVLAALCDYLEMYNINGHVKIWLAGYSRASAIVNLTAAKLIQDPKNFCPENHSTSRIYFYPTDIYSYGFEVPACTTSSRVDDERYGGIYNIVNPTDLVARVPLYKWGFTRYGKEVVLPAPGSAEYMHCIGEVKAAFQKIYKYALTEDKCPDLLTWAEVSELERVMGKLVRDREDYYDYCVKDVTTFLSETFLGEQNLERKAFVDCFILMLAEYAVLHPATTAELVLILNELDVQKLTVSHYSEYTMAWLEVLADKNVLENSIFSSADAYIGYLKLSMECPIEVRFFDEDDRPLGSFRDGQVSLQEDAWFYAEALEDGGVKLLIPKERELKMSVTATDTGKMNVSVFAYDLRYDQTERTMTYTCLPLETGKSYALQFSSGYTGLDFELSLKDPSGNRIKPNGDVSGDRIDRPTRSDATEAPWTEAATTPEVSASAAETTAGIRPAVTTPEETLPEETGSGRETVPQTSTEATKSPVKKTTSDEGRPSSDRDEDGSSFMKILIIVLAVLSVCGGAAAAVILTRGKKK